MASASFDAETGREDRLALAEGASAGRTQAVPFFEKETAPIASCGLHGKATPMYRSGNVLEMVQSLFFPNAEHLGNFPQVEACFAQGFGNFLTQRVSLLSGGVDSPEVFSSHDSIYSIIPGESRNPRSIVGKRGAGGRRWA
jgi:hypothetical protein